MNLSCMKRAADQFLLQRGFTMGATRLEFHRQPGEKRGRRFVRTDGFIFQ